MPENFSAVHRNFEVLYFSESIIITIISLLLQIIEEVEGPTGEEKSAIGVCAKFMNFVVTNTAKRRTTLEESSLSEEELNQLSSKQRKERSMRIKDLLEPTPGKLDHASIVACQVGYLEPAPLHETRRTSLLENWIHVYGDSGDFGMFYCISQPTIRYDMVRYDAIRYDTVRYGTIWHDTIGTKRCDTVRYCTNWYDTMRYNRYDMIRLMSTYDKIELTTASCNC